MQCLISLPRILSLALLLAGGSAGAATVHTWVDADGVRHFSDAPPGGEDAESELIEIRHSQPAPAAAEDPNSIVNQWARAREERLERERLNLERREARRAAEQTAAEIAALEREPELEPRNRAPAFVLPYPTRRLGYGVPHPFGNRGRDGFYKGRVDNDRFGPPRGGRRSDGQRNNGQGRRDDGVNSAGQRGTKRTAGFEARPE